MKRLSIFTVVALFLMGAIIRIVDLECDPPAFFGEGGQALTTDAAHLTLYAKNEVLFGQWDLFGYQPWMAFKISLVSALSWLLYSLFGVSRVATNLTGVILSLSGLGLFLCALRKYLSERALIFCTLFLMANFMAAIYGRLPFSENGLIFLAGLVFVVYTYWFDTLAGKILTGALIALCGLLGKAFGFLIVVGPAADILLNESGRNRARSILALGSSAAVVVGMFSLVFQSEGGLATFLWEHAAGGHGFPGGLRSVGGFLEHLIAVTTYSGLHVCTPVTSVLAYLFLVAFVLNRQIEKGAGRGIMFLVLWFLATLLIMSPFNYLPLRYQYALTIPLAVVAAFALDKLEVALPTSAVKVTAPKAALLLLLNWFFAYYVMRHTVLSSKIMAELYKYVWYALPVGLAITALQWAYFSRRALRIGPRFANTTAGVAICLFCIVSGWRYIDYYGERTYNIAEVNRDVAQILGPEAVVSGQYGPALTSDTHLRSLPYFITKDISEAAKTFSAYPVTHIAVSATDWKKWSERHPTLKEAPVIARYWIRDNIIYLVRTANVFRNLAAAEYRLSDYEEAVKCFYAEQPDSGFVFLHRFLARHSRCKSALVELYYVTVGLGDPREAEPIVQQLVSDFPTDFSIHMIAAVFYKALFEQLAISEHADLSRRHLDMATNYNPVNEDVLKRIYDRYPISRRIVW